MKLLFPSAVKPAGRIRLIVRRLQEGKVMKRFMEEFKTFALKGNMVDLAVGMIIGSAFTSIVSSLVNDIFMPLLSLLTGKIDFTNMFIALDGNHYETLEDAGAVAVIKYGSFITQVINFILVALVIFLVVKQINRMTAPKPKEEAPAAPDQKECPYCKTKIAIGATRCPHCTSNL